MTEIEFDQFILSQMPHFVAVNYQRFLEANTPREQVERALRVYNLGLRAMTIGLVSQYLIRDRDQVSDSYLNKLLRKKFSHITLDAWQEILFTTLHVYKGNRALFFIPELYDFYWDTSNGPPTKRPGIEQPFNRLTQIFFEIRVTPPDDTGWEHLAEEIPPLLHHYIEAMRFVVRYDLIRIIHCDESSYDFALHKGLQITTGKASRPKHEELRPGQLYLRKGPEDFLRLHPFLIYWEDSDGVEVFPSDTGVYDRFCEQLFYSLSKIAKIISNDENISKFIEVFFDTLEEVKFRPQHAEQFTWLELCEACKDISQCRMETVRDKYKPELYLQREKTYQAFNHFLHTSDKKCFVLVGKSGVGKSNFILAVGDALRESCQDRLTVLMYDGAHLQVTPSVTHSISRDFNRCFQLPGREITNIWEEIDQLDGINDCQVILYVDAINENLNAKELLRQLDRLLQQPWPWLKVVLSSRPETWENIRKGVKLSEGFYYREKGAAAIGVELEKFSYSERMDPFSREELPQVYAKYQQMFKLQTSYEALHTEMRKMLRDPLSLLLVAKTYETKEIPENLDASMLISQYVKGLLRSERLCRDDLRFLETQLVPLMTKEGDYRNLILLAAIDAAGGTLYDRIYSEQKLPSGRYVNQSFVNLVDSDILTQQEEGRRQSIGFKYERFYDYFVGKYLFEVYQQHEDKIAFLGDLVTQLERKLFLWGVLRYVVAGILEMKDYALIEQLGHTNDEFQADLLVNVLSEYYPQHQTELHAVLLRWLENRRQYLLAPSITAKIAISCLIEDILKHLLIHPNEKVRFLVVQAIHELWENDADLTRRVLHVLPGQVSLWHLSRSRENLKTLLYTSLLLTSRDYCRVGAATATTNAVRNLWKPIVERVFLVNQISVIEHGMKWLRRLVVWICSKIIVNMFKNAEREGLTYSFQDIDFFFPATAYQKNMMERLLLHFDAATGQVSEPVETLMALIEELATNDEEEDTSVLYNAAQVGIIAHFNVNPLQTAQALDTLLKNLEAAYPQTTDPEKPTASNWYNLGVNTFVGISYEDMNREIATQVLQVLVETSYTNTFRYFGRFRLACGKTMSIGVLDGTIPGYHFNIPEAGPLFLTKIVKFYIEQGKHKEIWEFGIPYLAMSMARQRMPEAGMRAVYDFIRILLDAEYLRQFDEEKQAQFWQQAADSLLERASMYKEHLLDLLERFEPGELPQTFIMRIRNAGREDNIGYNSAEAAMDAIRYAFKDQNPSLRNILKWFFRTGTEVKSLEELSERLIIYLLDVLYPGESLFRATRSPHA